MDAPEIPGLAEADAATEAVKSRLVALCERIADAEKAVTSATARRVAMVRAAAAGEEVSAHELANVDATIAAERGRVALLSEALPGVEKEMEAAEKVAWGCIQSAMQERREAARLGLIAAEAAETAAVTARREAEAAVARSRYPGDGRDHCMNLLASGWPITPPTPGPVFTGLGY